MRYIIQKDASQLKKGDAVITGAIPLKWVAEIIYFKDFFIVKFEDGTEKRYGVQNKIEIIELE